MDSYYEEVPIDKIKLDYDNPRIALVIERYGENVTAEAVALALGSFSGGTPGGTTFNSLKESIKQNKGVIHPIVLNKVGEEYTVIEGNTRVQIYRDFDEQGVEGNWKKIKSIVYEDLPEDKIHAIRLQSHLVGPRDWDPYSKAKYLDYLSNSEKLSTSEIISFCGGNKNEIIAMINAYRDMEKFYRPQLAADDEFDQRKFSAFRELQNKKIVDALIANQFTKKDFAKWVIDGNIDTMQGVRKIPAILSNKRAKEVFLKETVSEAIKHIDVPDTTGGLLANANYLQLSTLLVKKLANLPFAEVKRLSDIELSTDRDILLDLKYTLDDIIEYISSTNEE